MSICKKQFGTLSSGDDVYLYLLESGDFKAGWCDYGASWLSFIMPDARGERDDVILGFSSFPPYAGRHPYFGATVGRVANRIAGARFSLEGREYKLFANDGTNHLHGGKLGFGRRLWRGEMDTIDGDPAVRFALDSADGEEGYPGNLNAAVVARLTRTGEVRIYYEVETDKETPVNLTNHAYFNLSGEGRGTIVEHGLELRCDRYLPSDETLIPLPGEPVDVTGSPFDFRLPKRIGAEIEKTGLGYDHCFIIDSGCIAGNKPFAVVTERTRGRRMSVCTTSPAVQFYTGNFLDGIIGKNGSVYGKHTGFCLETQYFPDSPNRRDYPSCLAIPGEKWSHMTSYQFSII